MYSSNDTVNTFNTLLNQFGAGKLTDDQVDDVLDRGQLMVISEYIGLTSNYQPGHPIPPVAQSITQRAADALIPFKTPATVILTNGVGTFPSDYLILDNLRFTIFVNPEECGGVPEKSVRTVRVLRGYESPILSGKIKKPRLTSPYIEFLNQNTIKVYPEQIRSIQFSYYRRPKKFYWGRTFDPVTDTFVYNPNDPLNQPLEMYDIDQLKVIAQALLLAGINIRESDLVQAITIVKQEA